MKKNLFAVLFVVGFTASFASAQGWSLEGAPMGSGEGSLPFCGGVEHINTRIPTENLRSYSMSFWLNPTDFFSDSSFLGQTDLGINLGFDQGSDRSGAYNRLYQGHWGSNHSGETTVPSGSGDPDPDGWVHAVFTYDSDAGFAKIFFNGENDNGGGGLIDPPNRFGPHNFLILGNRNGGSGPGFVGHMDDVAFWDHVISDEDVAAIASGTSPTEIGDPAQLFYDFHQDSFEIDDDANTFVVSTAAGDGIWDVAADHKFSIPSPPHPFPSLEFKRPLAEGNWSVRMIEISGADSEINDLAEAKAIVEFANGGPNTNGWVIEEDLLDSRDRIDMARTAQEIPYVCNSDGWGFFPHDQPFPDGSGGDSQVNTDNDFLVQATTSAPFVFPEGTYSIGLGASVGELKVVPADGSEFSFTREWLDISPDDTLTRDGGIDSRWICGEFTVGPSGLEAHIESTWVQQGSLNYNSIDNLDGYEIAIGNGPCETPRVGVGDGAYLRSAETLSGHGEADSGGMNDGIRIAGVPRSLFCDLNGDGGCNIDDLDLLYLHNADFGISVDDINQWLADASLDDDAVQLVTGDLNLNGAVDSTDLGLLLNNFTSRFSDPPPSWADGDVNGSGRVDSTDLGELLNNFGFQSPNVAVVPEPGAIALWIVGMIFFGVRLRKTVDRQRSM